MKQFILTNKKPIGAVAVLFVFGAIMLSFADTPFVNQILNEQQLQLNDTVPLKTEKDKMNMKEFDRLTEKLDDDMLKVGEEMKKINLADIQKEVELSLKSVDVEKILKEVEQSLKEMNIEQMMADVKLSMKEIDWDKNNAEIQNALKEANEELEKAKIELKNVNQDEIKKELENAKLEIEKTKEEIKKIDVDKIMKEANEAIASAKLELKELKTMFKEMENDGLVDSKKGFKIEYKNKELYINGEKQSKSVADKYRKYFKEDPFEIEIEKE